MVSGQAGSGAQPRLPKVTIRDVAAAAGVSPATVSFVLNDTPGQTIPTPTRERVRTAATSLGYSPHGVARTLREGRSRIVLLHVGQLGGGNNLDGFVQGMSEELSRLDHSLLITTGHTDYTDHAERDAIRRDVLDAVAPRAVLDLDRIANSRTDDALLGVADGSVAGLAFHAVTQLRHLAERGHREIALAVPAGDGGAMLSARIEQAREAARELALGAPSVVRVDMGEEAAARAELVRSLVHETRATAVACYSDDVALAVLSTLSGLGLNAPDHLAVIGFGDDAHGRFSAPALTTVRIDSRGYGRRAARAVLGLAPGEWDQPPSWVVVRQST